MSKVIAAMQSGRLPMPTTEPAANPQAQVTEGMVQAAQDAVFDFLNDNPPAKATIGIARHSDVRALIRAALKGALSLSRPAVVRALSPAPAQTEE